MGTSGPVTTVVIRIVILGESETVPRKNQVDNPTKGTDERKKNDAEAGASKHKGNPGFVGAKRAVALPRRFRVHEMVEARP